MSASLALALVNYAFTIAAKALLPLHFQISKYADIYGEHSRPD
jgi:hypothetical protein